MSDNKMSAEDTFLSWKIEVKEIGKARYTSTERREQLDMLCEMFYKFGVDLDEARSYKRKVIEFMVTKEGMKGNGKHKGWKETTEEEFVGNLVGYYQGDMTVVNDTTNKKITRKIEFYGGDDYMDRTPIIVAWTKHLFKDNWTESVCLEAHRVGSSLWMLFDKQVVETWQVGEERPQWAKNVF